MKTDIDREILNTMATYGGSFAQAIARAALVADSENFIKLKAAFPELWDRYAEIACSKPFVAE